MTYHQILQSQLEKYLPKGKQPDPAYEELLENISEYYRISEQEKKASEQAFAISENGYRQVLENITKEVEAQRQSVRHIHEQIIALSPHTIQDRKIVNGGETLAEVTDFLETQLSKIKLLEEDLKKAREQVQLSAVAKANFLSVVSHEIRTPLNAIIGSVHILQQEAMLPAQEVYINSLQAAASNLHSLVNDILDFTRIDEGKIVLSPKEVDLRKLTGNIEQANITQANERKNKLIVIIDERIPNFLFIDETRVLQVLNNLVTNAIKFTTEGVVTIQAKLEATREDAVSVCFSISDTGIGIPAELHELIFERFTQANSTINRSYGGSGLGLTIIKKLLQLMGAEIKLESSPGKGSRFYFTLTCRYSQKNILANAGTHQPWQLNNTSILLVEDIPVNIIIAKKMLVKWGAEVDVAQNGEEAVNMAGEKAYQVILMDLQMPVMDGITATRLIRDLGIQTPIVALTASVTLETQQKIRDIGMNGYVSKPFNPSDLYTAISEFV
jgi:signal transduction histidine kinase